MPARGCSALILAVLPGVAHALSLTDLGPYAVDAEGAVGRSSADAPEIDGRVFLDGAVDLQPGDWVRATVTGADEYDLWAG